MNDVFALAAVVLMLGACVGAGTLVLAGLGLRDRLPRRESILWAFSVGFGVVGWLVFWPGAAGELSPHLLAGILIICCLGCVLMRLGCSDQVEPIERPDAIAWTLLAVAAAAMVLDVFEALAPATDSDTLAYHYAYPKRALAEGALPFDARAADGAVPFLVQMTYMPVLALGGERGLNLWTMVSGWAVAAFVYALVRRHLGINWSLAAAVVFLTTPAVLYGAGSGQVEIRLALFALVAAFAAAESRSSGDWRFAVLAGLAVGFFAGGKFTGLLFGAACGVVLLIGQRWLVRGTVFGLAVLAAGSQWYAWNWINAGDPVFPMTFKLLGTTEPGLWNEAQDAFFRSRYFGSESAVPSTLWWLIAYPFKATLDGLGAFESRRAGLGPYILLALPFALAGAWHARHRLARHALLAVTLIAIGFYVLWFLSGFSQRVRHVLPVYPLLLIPITVAAAHWATNRSRLFPLALFVGLTVAAQMAGQGLFALKFIHYQVAGENREAFLSRNVHRYAVVPWVNAALGESDRLLHGARQINFLLDVPYHQVHPMLQAEINLRPERVDPSESLARLRRRGVSHILTIALEDVPPAPAKGVGLPFLARDLVAAGCADPGPVVEAKGLASRTLPTERGKVRAQLLTLTREDCPW